MLQVTQTGNAELTGVLSYLELSGDGRLTSEMIPVTGGAIDRDQVTLVLRGGLFGKNLAGKIKWNRIELQAVGSKGEVLAFAFERSSPEEFRKYGEQLKAEANGISLGRNLAAAAQQLRQTIQGANRWLQNAELHAQRIPGVKDYFRKLEDQMRSLIARERATSNSVVRSQISVEVAQRDVQGTQADVQADQMWDQIVDAGRDLSRQLASCPSSCGTPEEFQKRGATSRAIEVWEAICRQAHEERARFEPVFNRIMAERAELKAFQASVQSHRQALVRESERIQ
jgi:hypothetical protein